MIERELRDGILTLRIAHGKAGAMDVELLEAFGREMDAVADARAVILTGTGSIFSAGVDLFRLVEEGEPYVRRFFPLLSDFVRKLFALPLPVIVAANGHAIAGGGIMIMAGDYRLLADGSARVGVPELLVGVPFPAAALEVVRFAVPADRVQALVYAAQTFPARDALAKGLVDEVVDPAALEERARGVAAQLGRIPTEIFRLTKQYLRGDAIERITRLAAANDAAALAAWCAADTHERIRAYLASTVRR